MSSTDQLHNRQPER